jgi:hypothetical protein
MIKSILYLCGLTLVQGYNLLANYVPTEITKHFSLCMMLDTKIKDTFINVIDDINRYNILYIDIQNEDIFKPQTRNGINEICDFNGVDTNYAYTTTMGNNETDIYISKLFIDKPTTLYNVVYHEILHSLGLNHTEEHDGLMKYKFYMNGNTILDDKQKLYPSLDDIKALRYIKRNIIC